MTKGPNSGKIFITFIFHSIHAAFPGPFKGVIEMVLEKKKQIVLWILWVAAYPLLIYCAYMITPPVDFQWVDFIGILFLLIPAALIPILVEDTTIIVTQWITLAAFLKWGLFTEFMLSQMTVVLALLRLRPTRDQWYRLPLNCLMFGLISIFSALIYYVLGGHHDPFTISDRDVVILAMVYLITYFIANQALYYLIGLLLMGEKRPIWGRDLLWDALLLMINFSIGLILYFLYNTAGAISLFFIGIPVISMLLLLNIYLRSERMNAYLQKAVEIGHRLTERLETEQIIEIFIQKVADIFPLDHLYIFKTADENQLLLSKAYDREGFTPAEIGPIRKGEGIAGHVWETGQAMIFGEKQKWIHLTKGDYWMDAESIMAVPIMKNAGVTGVVFIISGKKRAYEKFHLLIIDILTTYFSIALENARHYERTKYQSETCPLTHLYNARALTGKLEEFFDQIREGNLNDLSLLLIDIDHFKKVNDSYGHQSGNEILCQVADLLRSIVGSRGFLARYGGEEFIILFPDMKKSEAFRFAELLRETIESRPFVLYDDLSEVRRKLTVRITVSIGVSGAPEDTDDPITLIRQADRAMYLGAKREGRNRVAIYAKS